MTAPAIANRLYAGTSPEEVAEALRPLVDFRDEGISLGVVAALVAERLEPFLMKYGERTFQSMFNAVLEPGAALGARVALDWNQGVTNWQVSPGGAVLEELCADALVRLFGLSRDAGATFMLAGTYANQQAVYMALHRYAEMHGFDFAEKGLTGFKDPARLAIVISRDTHFSIRHAVRSLGLGERSLLTTDLDAQRRMAPHRLTATLRNVAGSRDVFCVVASAGTTSTGAVDPLLSIADVAGEQCVWMHVDAAYGFAYKLVPSSAALFHGIERADSVCWDPHKQLGVPVPSSLLFVKNRADFERMSVFSAYFNRDEARYPNPGLKSAPSTRPLAALALVTSILHQGMRGVVERLEAPLAAIKGLAARLEHEPDIHVPHTPDLGVLCFRFLPKDKTEGEIDALHRRIFDAVQRAGERSVAMTELDGKTMLRLVAISPAVTTEDLVETVDALRAIARSL
jgi:glutamate/tyrosine decarboxylase-like PLP-dependent enzyme